MELDLEFHLPGNSRDRRRKQNRVAQRKYRQKRGSQNVAPREEPAPGSRHAPGPELELASWLQPSPPLADGMINPDFNPDQLAGGLWDFGPGFGEPPSFLQTPNSSSNWSVTPAWPVDEALNFGPAGSSSSSTSSSLVPTSSKNKPPLPDGRLDPRPSTGASIPVQAYVVSPTPWLDDQLRPQPESAALEDGWLRPLHMAATKGNLRILKLLARHSPDINDTDSHGRTPLMHAVQGGHAAAVAILLANGAHLDCVDRERRSCLHWAALHRCRDVLEILLEHSAQDQALCSRHINAYDDAGWTPLHMAIDRGFEAGVMLLIEHGADVVTKAAKCPFAEVQRRRADLESSPSASSG